MERAYETWRTDQTARHLGDMPITRRKVGLEIGMLRRAINRFRRGTQIDVSIAHYVPERDTPPVTWWRRK